MGGKGFILNNFITFTHYNPKTSFKRPYNDRFEFFPHELVKVAWILEINRNCIWPSDSSRWECLYLICLGTMVYLMTLLLSVIKYIMLGTNLILFN